MSKVESESAMSFAGMFESARLRKKNKHLHHAVLGASAGKESNGRKSDAMMDHGADAGSKKPRPNEHQKKKNKKRRRPRDDGGEIQQRAVPADAIATIDDHDNTTNKRRRSNGGGGCRGSETKRPAEDEGRRGGDHHRHEKQQQKQQQQRGRQRQRQQRSPPRRPRRQPPSAEALALSAALKDLSRRKRLADVLEMYWDESNRAVRDSHHACAVIDCCSRCGADVAEAERVFNDPAIRGGGGGTNNNNNAQAAASVELLTSLLKAYAHSGEIAKAETLFEDMCTGGRNNGYPPPNIRSLNTVLRGCLWSAASAVERSGGDGRKLSDRSLTGGVVTSERVWKMFREKVGSDNAFDLSSYEYSISILCQALEVDRAEQRIAQLQSSCGIRSKGKAGFVAASSAAGCGSDPSSAFETIAASYLALSRAHAMLGRADGAWTSCQRCLNAVNMCRKASSNHDVGDDDGDGKDRAKSTSGKKKGKKQKPSAGGGKRSWKHKKPTEGEEADGDGSRDARRADSNAAFRGHRLAEFEMEARGLLKTRGKQSEPLDCRELQNRLLNQLLCFAGGATTSLLEVASSSAANSAYSLSVAAQPRNIRIENIERFRMASWYSYGASKLHESLEDGDEVFSSRRKILRENGSIDFNEVFENTKNSKRPLDIELGAGFGDWIVGQAHNQPSRNYVSVELRADRVYQTFAKATLGFPDPLRNLCNVGCDAESFLRERVGAVSVSTIFVHHPEPPTQTYGEDRADVQSIIAGGTEPAHMLSSATLVAAARCLKKDDGGGRLVIVSDNHWYARLICATLARVRRQQKKGKPILLRSVSLREAAGAKEYRELRHVESFDNGSVELYQRESSSRSGAAVGSTWFDRLWRTGAGSHAERTTRFVVIMLSV